jgi:hypothetical protein
VLSLLVTERCEWLVRRVSPLLRLVWLLLQCVELLPLLIPLRVELLPLLLPLRVELLPLLLPLRVELLPLLLPLRVELLQLLFLLRVELLLLLKLLPFVQSAVQTHTLLWSPRKCSSEWLLFSSRRNPGRDPAPSPARTASAPA